VTVATFAEAGAYAEDPTFIRQVKVALTVAGGTVAIEDRSQYPDSAMFSYRKTLAVNVLQDPYKWAGIFAVIVMYDDRVRAAAPTADNPNPPPVDDFLLAGIIYWTWNAVAGAGPSLLPPPASPDPFTGQVSTSGEGGLVVAGPVLVAHAVGKPLPVRTEGDEDQVQLRAPVPPPGAPAGWPGVPPWGL
jgi:hypothetical protein